MFARFHHDVQDQQAEDSLLVVAHSLIGLEENEHFEDIEI